MAHRLFEGRDHAASYWKYRVSPPMEIMNDLLGFVEQRGMPFDLAVDVGCGSGQGTVLLAAKFASVVGTDVSPAQLEMAQKHSSLPNITYKECPAEELPFPDSSVDLVTAMTAFHWFDRACFLQEADRILKPRGCLAVLSYDMDMELQYQDCSERLNDICRELYDALIPHLSPYINSGIYTTYHEAYNSLPYTEKKWKEALAKESMPLSSYMGMVESFGCYHTLLQKDPEEAKRLSQDITSRLLAVMGVTSAETEVGVVLQYYYLMASKPVDNGVYKSCVYSHDFE